MGITRFLYGGDELMAEYNSAGSLLRQYAHGVGDDDPVYWIETGGGSGTHRFFHRDHQGSIIAVTTSSLAAPIINTYDEYGIPGAGNEGRFQYTGQAWIPELGMYYYKARIYSPTLGRFLQTDPIGYEDQINLYAYVGNDPVNGVDSTGLTCARTDERVYACEIDRIAYLDDHNKVQYRSATAEDHEKYETVETALTNAANAADKAGNSKFEIKVPGVKPFHVTGDAIAKNLESSTVTVDPNDVSRDPRIPNAKMSMNPGDLRVYSSALDTTRGFGTLEQLTVEFLHEGIHQTRQRLKH